jgi:NAD(P)H-hydrate epimerase
VIVSDLGFPWDSLDFEAEFMAIERAVAGAAVPSRSRQAHKGDFGHVLVAGGSEGMSGAPSLAGRGALRSGAGLVTIAAPKSCRGAVAGANPEAMSLSIGCGGSFTEEDGKEAAVAAEARSVLCLGMGIGRSDGSAAFVRSLLERTSIPAVVDADALAALVGHEDSLRSRRGPVVLTPHPGECARLLGRSATEVQADRVASVRQAASRYGAIVVLKGASTLVCDGREGGNDPKRVWVNTTGNPGMATAGSGDVLAGCIAARIGQGPDLLQAVLAGVWMHGRAGDIASREVGPVGIVSGDIADRLPRTIQELEEAT